MQCVRVKISTLLLLDYHTREKIAKEWSHLSPNLTNQMYGYNENECTFDVFLLVNPGDNVLTEPYFPLYPQHGNLYKS